MAMTAKTPANARLRGRRPPLVHGGTLRSQFGETSEAMFLTQGYRLRHARRRPKRASRARSPASSIRATPTRPSPCSRSACALLEGAEDARATATGMAAVTAALLCICAGRRPRRGGARAVRLLPLCDRGAAAALRHRLDAGRRHATSSQWKKAVTAEHQGCSSWRARPTRRSS